MADGVQRVRVPGFIVSQVSAMAAVKPSCCPRRQTSPGQATRLRRQRSVDGAGGRPVHGGARSAPATNRPPAAVGRPCSTPDSGRADDCAKRSRRLPVGLTLGLAQRRSDAPFSAMRWPLCPWRSRARASLVASRPRRRSPERLSAFWCRIRRRRRQLWVEGGFSYLVLHRPEPAIHGSPSGSWPPPPALSRRSATS